MHICNKCRKYNKCYPHGKSKTDENVKRADIELAGCPDFNELTVEEMFGLKEGTLNEPKH